MAQKKSAPHLALAVAAAAIYTGITLWHRWPIIMSVFSRKLSAKDAAELNRMATEKMKTAVVGLTKGQAEFVRNALAAMLGKLNLSDVAHIPVTVAEAALRPAFRTVKKNSRRLGKRRRRS